MCDFAVLAYLPLITQNAYEMGKINHQPRDSLCIVINTFR